MFDIPLEPSQGAAFLIAALILPVVIALVKQAGFTSQINSLIALACYAVFAVVGILVSGIELKYENLVPLTIAAALAGRLAYGMVWSKIGADADGNGSIDERITLKTSLVK